MKSVLQHFSNFFYTLLISDNYISIEILFSKATQEKKELDVIFYVQLYKK